LENATADDFVLKKPIIDAVTAFLPPSMAPSSLEDSGKLRLSDIRQDKPESLEKRRHNFVPEE